MEEWFSFILALLITVTILFIGVISAYIELYDKYYELLIKTCNKNISEIDAGKLKAIKEAIEYGNASIARTEKEIQESSKS